MTFYDVAIVMVGPVLSQVTFYDAASVVVIYLALFEGD